MDRILYVAASGAKQRELAQATLTHNLANASTTGFQGDLASFRTVDVRGPGHDARAYAMAEYRGVDHTRGSLQATGRDLDVAVNGEGWIAIQAPDGTEAYTRAGDLRVASGGLLVNGAGHPVMGNAGPVAIPPNAKLEIGSDGTVSVQPLGQEPNTLATVDRVKLVQPDPAQLVKGADGLLRLRDGGEAPADANVRLVSGSLESSNVNSVESLVGLIGMAREFDMHVKIMETAKSNDSASAQLLRIT